MIWRNTETLFTHMSRHPAFESNPRQQGHIYVLWANHEAANERPESATQLLDRAQQVYVAAMQRAVAAGDYAEALALLSHVERHFGLTPVLRREKGAWLLRETRVAEARSELQMAATTLSNDERLRALLAEVEALATKSGPPPGRP
jgi:predicted Zn-dependent protease